MTHLRINRRTLLTGTVALGTVGLLAACGGGSDKKISGKAASSTEEIVKNLEINSGTAPPQAGWRFRGSVSAIGPNFNILTQSGYTTENLTAFGGACNIPSAIGFTSLSPAGEYSLNDDYVSDYKAETVGGVQTITFKLNSGCLQRRHPVDIEAIRAAWTVYRNPDDGYNVIAAPFWQQVASIDPVDGDKTRVKIVMSKPLYPAGTLGLLGLHPALTDKELFNNGFVNKPMDQYWSGPSRLASGTLRLRPHPRAQRQVVGREASAGPHYLARNGRRSRARSVPEWRAGQYRLCWPGNLQRCRGSARCSDSLRSECRCRQPAVQSDRVTDTVLRRAVFAAVDRSQLAKVKFSQINWEEPLTGSLIAMPFQKGYQDAMPTNPGAEAAAKILEQQATPKSGDYYARTAARLQASPSPTSVRMQPPGSVPEQQAAAQAAGISSSRKSAAVPVQLVMGSKQYDCAFSGWGVVLTPQTAFSTSTPRNQRGCG